MSDRPKNHEPVMEAKAVALGARSDIDILRAMRPADSPDPYAKGYRHAIEDAIDALEAATPTASLRQGEATYQYRYRITGADGAWYDCSAHDFAEMHARHAEKETRILFAPPIASPIELSVDRVLRGPLAVNEGRLDANDRTALADGSEGKLKPPAVAPAGNGSQDNVELDVAIGERTPEHDRKNKP